MTTLGGVKVCVVLMGLIVVDGARGCDWGAGGGELNGGADCCVGGVVGAEDCGGLGDGAKNGVF